MKSGRPAATGEGREIDAGLLADFDVSSWPMVIGVIGGGGGGTPIGGAGASSSKLN